ncbi:MAG: hypothetical protein ACTHJT_05765, partial [Cytophaga sp.]|uniref:hypothetical protein n=1 Tax=Cytophaga sp. TaxID=29535 RepID=UPI003F814D8B
MFITKNINQTSFLQKANSICKRKNSLYFSKKEIYREFGIEYEFDLDPSDLILEPILDRLLKDKSIQYHESITNNYIISNKGIFLLESRSLKYRLKKIDLNLIINHSIT